jgi:hypothetical protein
MNNSEIEYKELFSDPNYNSHSSSELRFQFVMNYIKNSNLKTLIDIGSGRGNLIRELLGSELDIEINSADLDKFHAYNVPFYKLNILKEADREILLNKNYDLLTCLDVMEHLDKSQTDEIFKFFSKISSFQIFTIANHPDIQEGKDIHTIQEKLPFWINSVKKSLKINYIQRVKFFSKPDSNPELKRYNYLYIFITSSVSDTELKIQKNYTFQKLNDSLLNLIDKISLIFR